MKESAKKHIRKPGLEEALHPEIGNDASWEENPHAYGLRLTDPLKAMDDLILDTTSYEKISQTWSGPETELDAPETNPSATTEKEAPEDQMTTTAARPVSAPSKKQVRPTRRTKQTKEVKSSSTEMEGPSVTPKKEKKKKDKPVAKVGKRIRKVARKVKKEEEIRQEELFDLSPALPDPVLSPFTSWLKGLAGSEYVHPYDDDFAIRQSGYQAGEGISETFADLLAAQGYKAQAIAMYTQLMEKFPGKSRFFAAKIDALQ